MTDSAPAVSAGYREQLASAIRARQKWCEDTIFDELIKDRNFAPVDPDRATTARQIARKAVAALMRPAIT